MDGLGRAKEGGVDRASGRNVQADGENLLYVEGALVNFRPGWRSDVVVKGAKIPSQAEAEEVLGLYARLVKWCT
jgi:hypothetical protein